jgi:16S rRNA (guanine(966)-N(2))-methyltransferase RsmD
MRVISGRIGGKKLYTPKPCRIRTTTDRVKEALFNILPSVDGAFFLDLFAGTGNIGIEALSRGATMAVFVDKDPLLADTIRKNLDLCGLKKADEYKIIRADFERGIRLLSGKERLFDIVFADPPYDRGFAKRTLELLDEVSLVADDGIAVIEHSFREEVGDEGKFILKHQKRYGDTVLSFLKIL